MQVAGGKLDDGIVIGNTFDKYGSQNPIVKRIMSGFDDALAGFVRDASPKTIHEVGCGEGYWVVRWLSEGYDVRGSDFSGDVIGMAKTHGASKGVNADRFLVKSVYDLDRKTDSADLIVCCEVMEHLEEPEKALQAIASLEGKDLILSVPREPLWRVLNMARGKYVTDLGNTPGHIQHFSKSAICKLVGKYFDIENVASPLPWTMIHAKWK